MLPSNIAHKKQRVRKKGKTRYSSKEYSNPFFTKKKKKRINALHIDLGWKAKLIVFALLIVLVIALWAVFYSGYFTIKTITVSGGGRVEESSVKKIASEQIGNNFLVLFPQKNLWLFNSKKLISSLEEKYAFNTLYIKKKWPTELAITYDEKDYDMVWVENDNYYYSDITGFIIEEANLLDIGQKDYPIIENRSNNKISSKQATVDTSLIRYGLELYRSMKTYEADFVVSRIIIDNEVNTVKASLLAGPEVYFNTEEEIQKQIEKLLTVKREKISNDFAGKTYIDVRYGNSVYYR